MTLGSNVLADGPDVSPKLDAIVAGDVILSNRCRISDRSTCVSNGPPWEICAVTPAEHLIGRLYVRHPPSPTVSTCLATSVPGRSLERRYAVATSEWVLPSASPLPAPLKLPPTAVTQ